MPLVDAAQWSVFLARHPAAHILQTAAWGELKSAFGWQAERVVAGEAGAQILFRRLPLGFTLAYIPRGPIGAPNPEFWAEIDAICRSRRAVFLKVEPDIWEEEHAEIPQGFRPSPHSIQPRRTVVINLQGSEEELLARMKQKTRYNIGLAEKKGVIVRPWEDIAGFSKMMDVTAARDEFGVHSEAYYRKAHELFHSAGTCELLVAEYEGKPLAALMAFARGPRAWYFYGASTNEERNRMPTYLLQWEAMRWARAKGCTEYDLWGVPDEDESQLEAQFEARSDGLWGVYRFKRGFGGTVKRAASAIDRVYISPLYTAYKVLIECRKIAN